MVSCHGEKGKKELLARPVIKTVGENEMMGMMELVREVETDIDPATGDYPTDVVAESKCQLLVLTQETYANELKGKGSKASAMFCDNLDSITRASVVAWLHKVKLFKQLGPSNLEMLSEDPGAAPGTQIVVGHLGAGDFFGESSILGREDEHHGANHLASTASLRTTSESLFIYFHADEMRKVFLEVPEIRRASTSSRIHEGDVVFEKDSHGIDFYVLVQGAVSIDDGEDVHVTLDHKGAYLGGRALAAEARGDGDGQGQHDDRVHPGRDLPHALPHVAVRRRRVRDQGAGAAPIALLTHPSDRAAAEKTLDDEFASENYRFWLDAEDYKSNHAMGGDPKDLWAQVDKIYATRGYVDFIAELAVYTPRKDQNDRRPAPPVLVRAA
ncbi:cAMP-dependent protein kinase regulator [Aureococcus anophagefferens]|nr:cAMP-dependent protein kinase regulator [Aureococcus anophagefferens]